MALAHIETERPSGTTLSLRGEISSSSQKEPLIIPDPFIEPIPAERLRFIEGRGIDLRYDPKRSNPYKDYEDLVFKEKAKEAAQAFREGKEDAIWFGPFLTDYIWRERDFERVHKHDISKWKVVDGEMFLDTVAEIKTNEEFREDARQMLKEDYGIKRKRHGLPVLVRVTGSGDFLKKRIKYALSGAMYLPSEISSPTSIGEDGVHVLFISPDSQEGRTMFLRPGVSHEIIEMPEEMRTSLIEFEKQQRAVGEARKLEKTMRQQAA